MPTTKGAPYTICHVVDRRYGPRGAEWWRIEHDGRSLGEYGTEAEARTKATRLNEAAGWRGALPSTAWPSTSATRPWAEVAGWFVVVLTLIGALVASGLATSGCPGGDCSGDYLMYPIVAMIAALAVLVVGTAVAAVVFLVARGHDIAAAVLGGIVVLGFVLALSAVA